MSEGPSNLDLGQSSLNLDNHQQEEPSNLDENLNLENHDQVDKPKKKKKKIHHELVEIPDMIVIKEELHFGYQFKF